MWCSILWCKIFLFSYTAVNRSSCVLGRSVEPNIFPRFSTDYIAKNY